MNITSWQSLTNAHGTRVELTWQELAERLADPEPRPANAEHPQLGGWSPATFASDYRKKENVEQVTALGLDLDEGGVSLEQVRAAFAGRSAIVHSTRRYTPETPRWRVVVQLTRPVTADEHAAIWTRERDRLAALGIALDEQTKDPSRFWFLPCVSVSIDYVIEVLEGDPLSVDYVKVTTPRPEPMPSPAPSATVASSPPKPASEEPPELRRITMATRKRRAAAYVARAEVSVSGQDGHKVAMRVATAVVRGFALGDGIEARAVLADWNARCEPPWSSAELSHKISEAARVGALPWGKMLLAAVEDAEPESDGNAAKKRAKGTAPTQLWEARLIRDRHKQPKRLLANVMLVLTHVEEWAGALAWDEFAERIIITRACPAGPPGPWGDVADSLTAEWIQQSRWPIECGPELVAAAVRAVADRHRIHPVRDWLKGLEWDGTARIDGWLVHYLGVEDTPYARAVGRRWLVSAVARVFRPGCQVDSMLILEGEQGVRKSSAMRALASDEWFLDTGIDVRDKEAPSSLRAKWIVEMSELAALRGGDVERTKQFVSVRVDTYRPKYGRHFVDHPRQCVFVGTTNARQYLRDGTGGRRYWPVRVEHVDLDALAADRDQLWAEARVAFAAGEPWYLETAELEGGARDEQEARRAVDPWEETVAEYLNAAPRQNSGVVIADVMNECLKLEVSKRTRIDEMRIGEILSTLGWVRARERRASSRPYVYRPPVGRAGRAEGRAAESETKSNVSPTGPTGPTHSSKTYDAHVINPTGFNGEVVSSVSGRAGEEESEFQRWLRDEGVGEGHDEGGGES